MNLILSVGVSLLAQYEVFLLAFVIVFVMAGQSRIRYQVMRLGLCLPTRWIAHQCSIRRLRLHSQRHFAKGPGAVVSHRVADGYLLGVPGLEIVLPLVEGLPELAPGCELNLIHGAFA